MLNADGTINVRKSIENAFGNNRYNFMVGMDLHQVPREDKEQGGTLGCYCVTNDEEIYL